MLKLDQMKQADRKVGK